MKENKKKKAVIAGAAVIVAGIIVFALIAGGNSSAKKIAELLDLGNKYVTEQDYEEAIVAFQDVIAIDPKCEEAYLGLADVYIAMDDYESAIDILQQGIEQTVSEELAAYLEEIKETYARIQEEAAVREREAAEAAAEREREAAEENERIAERVEDIWNFIIFETPICSVDSDEHFLTYDQIEAFCRPLAEELEMYLEQGKGDWEATAWCRLAELYCHMSELDKCMETRRRGYEATGDEALIPEQSYLGEQMYDEYGRFIDSEISDIYGEGDRIIMEDRTTLRGYPDYTEYEYDDLGRISKTHTRVEDSEFGEILSDGSYEYQSDNSVIVTVKTESNIGSNIGTYTLIYNEYGKVVDRTEIVYVWL